MPDRPRASPALVLAVAVAAISAAAVLFNLAEGVHPVAAAFWRTAAVGTLLAPSLRPSRGALAALTRRDGGLVVLGGLLLAGHFWSWFAALQSTTVLRGTLLVCLTPVWAGFLEWGLLRRRPTGRFFLGIGLALVGTALMSLPGAQTGGGDLRGDALALFGGVLSASYLLVGRSVRQRVGIGPYGSLVCGATAAWLLLAALVLGIPLTGFSAKAWAAVAGLALGPQLLGHIGLNYAVGYLPAAVVSGVVLLEPVGAAAIGAAVLGEIPSWMEIAGSLVVMAGVGAATAPARRRRGAGPPPPSRSAS